MTMNMECAVTAASKLCSSSTTEMPPELALHLFENGGFLIFTGVPQNTEFGIDYKSWTVGPNFCGLKMIPPGVHFIYFSVKNAPRIGFFHDFKEREVLIRKWDHSREDMMIDVMHTEEASKIRDNLKQMDRRLAPYPYENYRNWFALSNYIKGRSIERLRPENEYGRISGQAELMTMEDEVMERAHEAGDYSSSSRVDREHPNRLRFVDHEGLPIMRVRPGFEIRFQEIPAVVLNDKRTPRNGNDHSAQLEDLINGLDGEWTEVLAELQFAFICFLLGQVYEGFEQWKRLIHLLCSCNWALSKYPELYINLLQVIHFQLKECPKDFFVDIVSRNNFLTTTLSNLFGNIADDPDLNVTLKEKANKFKALLTKRFKWNFDAENE